MKPPAKIILLNADDEEPWHVECQQYPRKWLDPDRKERWAAKAKLHRVAKQMVDQGIAGEDQVRMAVIAGWTMFEAYYIAKSAKTGRYRKKK